MLPFALLVATPVFGLSYDMPNVLDIEPIAELASTHHAVAAISPVQLEVADVADEPTQREDDMLKFAADMRRRQELAQVHRALGIATWASMAVTLFLGTIQYYNLYGFFAGQGDNPCVRGEAIFGQGQCSGTPWPHRIAAFTTAGLYAGTFALSLAMPDPANLAEGKGELAEKVQIHKILRWIHFGGMLAQMFLGVVAANGWFGLDRANDYEALRALATAHYAVGWLTFGTLTAAGAMMVF